ncbi:MAG: hypothetical protein JXB19_10525 [Bacteroidales bacterium]|nr:hypothetical protein [Bacteroidales bacterium]
MNKRILEVILIAVSFFVIQVNAQVIRSDAENISSYSEEEYYYTLIEATKQYILNNYLQAINLYNECLKIKPESSAVNFQISQILVSVGDINRARQYAINAYNNDKNNKWYIINLINIYRNAQELDSAVHMLELLISMEKDGIEYKYVLAGLYELQGKYGNALLYLNEVEKQIGVSKEIILNKYRLYRISGEEENALNELNKAKQFFNDDYTILGMAAEYYRDIDNRDSAQYYYNLIIPEYKDNLDVAVSYSEFLLKDKQIKEAENIMVDAMLNSQISKEEKISFVYQMLQDELMFNRMQAITDTLSKILLQTDANDINIQSLYADIQFRRGNFTETSRMLKNIVEQDENNYVAWEQMLYTENVLSRTDSVIKYSKLAGEIFRTRPLPFLYLGSGYLQAKEYEKALESLKYGVEYANSDPVKIQFFNLIADGFHKISSYDSAWNYYEKALQIDADNTVINNNYAYYLAEENLSLDKALRISKKTIMMEPMNSTYLDTYAWILYKMKKVRKARKIIEKAIYYDETDDPDILDHFGDILYSLRKYDESILIWNKVLQIDRKRNEDVSEKIRKALEKAR